MPAGEIALVRCCVVGGGPAGMMLGFLLARAGVDVVVLEKHADFLRDFRGDTIHPSTLEVIARARPARRLPAAAPPGGAAAEGGGRRTAIRRRLQPPADALQVHRPDAAVGFPRLPRRTGQALSGLSPADAGRGGRPGGGGRARRGRPGDDAERPARGPGATWWSAPTAATRPCGSCRVARRAISACRWTCCGSGSRGSADDPAAARPRSNGQHHRHARPQRLLPVRPESSQRGLRRPSRRGASTRSAPARRAGPFLRDGVAALPAGTT